MKGYHNKIRKRN